MSAAGSQGDLNVHPLTSLHNDVFYVCCFAAGTWGDGCMIQGRLHTAFVLVIRQGSTQQWVN